MLAQSYTISIEVARVQFSYFELFIRRRFFFRTSFSFLRETDSCIFFSSISFPAHLPYHFALSMCYYFFAYNTVWKEIRVTYMMWNMEHFGFDYFFFRQHNSIFSHVSSFSFCPCFPFFFITRFVFVTHIFPNIFMHIGRCNGFQASFSFTFCHEQKRAGKNTFHQSNWMQKRSRAHTHVHSSIWFETLQPNDTDS